MGKPTAMPAMALAAVRKMFAAFHTIPPSMAQPTLVQSMVLKFSRNDSPSEPRLPRVKAPITAVRKKPKM